jgi:hypothetical protein
MICWQFIGKMIFVAYICMQRPKYFAQVSSINCRLLGAVTLPNLPMPVPVYQEQCGNSV